MEKHLILSIITNDKPGVVKTLARTIKSAGGNWLESQLSQLAGKFAGVIRVRVDEASAETLIAALTQLDAEGIFIRHEWVENSKVQEQARTALFTAVGPDRPGIVLEIAEALAQFNINVENLNTHCTSMPYSGDPLFEAEGELRIPMETPLDDVIEQLSIVADHLAMDIQLEESALDFTEQSS